MFQFCQLFLVFYSVCEAGHYQTRAGMSSCECEYSSTLSNKQKKERKKEPTTTTEKKDEPLDGQVDRPIYWQTIFFLYQRVQLVTINPTRDKLNASVSRLF